MNFLETLKNKYQIVVARYNEDIKWLIPFKLVTIIYNKGDDSNLTLKYFNTINLKNVGRESHTYLYHIIQNYNNLKDRTIFIQGKITDHKILDFEDYFKDTSDFIAKTSELNIDKLKIMIEHYGKWSKENIKKSDYTPYDWIKKVIGIDTTEIVNNESSVIWGANFSISKEMILRKPKKFYENLLRFLDNHVNPEEGHYMERSWYILFNHSHLLNQKKNIGFIFYKYNLKHYDRLIEKVKYLQKTQNNNYDELHIWSPLKANDEYGKYFKIMYTPNNNKYNLICPSIKDNSFYIDIKGSNDAHILVEIESIDKKENYFYEIVLGGWNNNISVIRDYTKGKIISSYENEILDKSHFTRFNISFNNKIEIFIIDKKIFDVNIFQEDNHNLTEIKNIYNSNIIKSVMIKSYYGSDMFWDYDFSGKGIYLCNNIYEEDNIISNIYNKYYAEDYINKIELIDLID
jgi:hypothetical protein